jgi:hypothetical protein
MKSSFDRVIAKPAIGILRAGAHSALIAESVSVKPDATWTKCRFYAQVDWICKHWPT